jgi:DNA-binding MarR family transcriptional regulator
VTAARVLGLAFAPRYSFAAMAADAAHDRVDEIVRLWSEARPDLDPAPMAPIGRILRLARHYDRELAPVYRAKGLDFGLFDVLATLRRVGPPYRLTAGELDDWCMVSSGGMTARLLRLEEAGLVARRQDTSDGRVVRVELTPGGVELIDELVVLHLEREEELLASLTVDERTEVAGLLRRLLAHFE